MVVVVVEVVEVETRAGDECRFVTGVETVVVVS